VYPPTFDWHRMVQRPHHLLWEAARAGHVVIFCNVSKRTDRAMESVGERFYVCHNFDVLLRTQLPKPVIYFTDPTQVPLVRSLQAERVVFDVVDDLPAWRSAWPEAFAAAQDVWCASEELVARVASARPDARLVPNACDFAHWSRPAAEPVAAAVLPHPRVGYIGRISDWVDVPAICAAARELPQVHFLLVGPVETVAFREADGIQNIHCLGERFYPQLPAYAHACDAMMVPYRADDETARAADPVKLWNLRAVGRPIVTGGADLIASLRQALYGEPDAAEIERVRELAAARRWADSWHAAEATWEGVLR
jgi:glycosyltransferase involved in cell wall biosynthesis